MRVIITGAAGRIGHQMIEELSESHELCLIDRMAVPGRPSTAADLSLSGTTGRRRLWLVSRRRRWEEQFEGVEIVLHLAGEPRVEAPWQQLLHDNIQATWNVLEAAARHRVRRVIFASSNWVVRALENELAPVCYESGGPKIGADAPPRPVNAYGTTKAFGETAGRAFVDEKKIGSFVAVRIGSYLPAPPADERIHRWIGVEDIRSLLRRCVEAKFAGFHVVYGVSAQPRVPYDLSHTRRLLSWAPRQLP